MTDAVWLCSCLIHSNAFTGLSKTYVCVCVWCVGVCMVIVIISLPSSFSSLTPLLLSSPPSPLPYSSSLLLLPPPAPLLLPPPFLSYLYCKGDLVFKQWKRRFFVLMQLTSQYRFLLCSYKPMETVPQKQFVLDRYSVECLSNEES